MLPGTVSLGRPGCLLLPAAASASGGCRRGGFCAAVQGLTWRVEYMGGPILGPLYEGSYCFGSILSASGLRKLQKWQFPQIRGRRGPVCVGVFVIRAMLFWRLH